MREPGQRRGPLNGATVFVVNPAAGGGRAGREWPRLEPGALARCAPAMVVRTTHINDATTLAHQAAEAGVALVVAVGGDGTTNEVVNGLMRIADPARRPALGIVALGTGRDLVRTLGGSAGAQGRIDALTQGRERDVDVGRVRFTDGGTAHTRYFLNVASFGLSGVTDRLLAAGARRWLPARLAFQLAVVRALGVYRNVPVRVTADGTPAFEGRVKVVALANGRYFGGSMCIAPQASLDDGLLDVVIVGDLTVWQLARNLGAVYRGEHLTLTGVTFLRARAVDAEVLEWPKAGSPAPKALLDLDGEPVGALPATFDVLPRALRLRS